MESDSPDYETNPISGGYTLSVARLSLAVSLFVVSGLALAQEPVVQEPPEEDVNTSAVKEYTFNPLQAAKEIRVGNYYFKKGSHRAAARRFEEALKWDPNSAEAYLRLGDTKTKLGDKAAARAAYLKYLELEPESREAAAIRKKVGVMPPPAPPAQASPHASK
jgi:tetratricopeptide (TPR) repeat protein